MNYERNLDLMKSAFLIFSIALVNLVHSQVIRIKVYEKMEFNTFDSAGFCDTDRDGVENRLDLDSDGDGCSDAYEAKTTTSTTTDFQYASNLSYGTNGFLNTLETTADNGI